MEVQAPDNDNDTDIRLMHRSDGAFNSMTWG